MWARLLTAYSLMRMNSQPFLRRVNGSGESPGCTPRAPTRRQARAGIAGAGRDVGPLGVLHKRCGRFYRESSPDQSYGTHLCVYGPDLCQCRIRFPSRFGYRDGRELRELQAGGLGTGATGTAPLHTLIVERPSGIEPCQALTWLRPPSLAA